MHDHNAHAPKAPTPAYPPTWRIGLTGGIGSGKSTVAAMLVACGAQLVDSDGIAKSLTVADGAAMMSIVRQFGAVMQMSDGSLNRTAMRRLVFEHPEARAQLEAITHPLIFAQAQQQVQQAITKKVACVVLDIPLLVEKWTHWQPLMDGVLVVDSLESEQIDRVMARSGLTKEMVQHIMRVQAPRSLRLSCADWVIFNSGLSMQQLRAHTFQLAGQWGLVTSCGPVV